MTRWAPLGIEDFAHFLESRGAVRLDDLEKLSTVGRSVKYFINPLEANPSSAPSGASSALSSSAARKTRAWAEAGFGDPDAAHPARRLTKYLCWEPPAHKKRYRAPDFP